MNTFMRMSLVGLVLVCLAASAVAQTVQVTFLANTATVPDTLHPTSFVQIRGSIDMFGPWGPTSTAILTNIGGDYWTGTYALNIGDTIYYKFFTNANSSLTPEREHQGWENNLRGIVGSDTLAANDRVLIVGSADTTLPIQYVNGSPSHQDQYWRPFTPSDTVDVFFRVNMASNEGFNKTNQVMGVRGSAGTLSWSTTTFLTQESQHGNGGSQQYDGTNFWSGVARFPVSTKTDTVYYKFVVHNKSDSTNPAAWEDGIPHGPPDVEPGGGGNPARIFWRTPAMEDSTLVWRFWADRPMQGFQGEDTVVITFRANMLRALSERGFAHGDTVEVRAGYGNSAAAVYTNRLTRQGLTTIYAATDTIITQVGEDLNYQYYLVKNNSDYREVFYDFTYSGTDVALAERRRVTVASKSITVQDTATSESELRRMPRFRNLDKLAQNVTVTFTVDIRPAYYQVLKGDTLDDIQGNYDVVHPDSVIAWGVWMNGPATGGWASWGGTLKNDTTRKLYDDGTHGDAVAGDSIYTRKITFYKDSTNNIIGQEFKFGIAGGDNEGGFGNNHIENIDDQAPTTTIASQFGSIDPLFYNAWDFDARKPVVTAVEDLNAVPYVFSLGQNYPNPFNPSTTIEYTIPQIAEVTFKVFNILGQEVMNLNQGKQIAGKHVFQFDASRLATGVYFYQIHADTYVATRKMILVK